MDAIKVNETPETHGLRKSGAEEKNRVPPDNSHALGDKEECSLEPLCNTIGFVVDSLSCKCKTNNKYYFLIGVSMFMGLL